MLHPLRRQAGAALVTSLIILIVLALIGTSAIATGFVQLRMSGNSQEQAIAAAGAQSAINTALRFAMAGDEAAAERSGHVLFDSFNRNPNADRLTDADANAALLCMNRDQDANPGVAGAGCPDATERLVDGTNNLLVRAQARVFYRGPFTGLKGCPGYSGGGTVDCSRYEIEGRAWIDDGDGQMERNQGETSVIQRHWAWREVARAGI